MSQIYTSADQLISGTPLLELTHTEERENLDARILGKLEYQNPAGLRRPISVHSALCGYG